jgi:hypothetical protein
LDRLLLASTTAVPRLEFSAEDKVEGGDGWRRLVAVMWVVIGSRKEGGWGLGFAAKREERERVRSTARMRGKGCGFGFI